MKTRKKQWEGSEKQLKVEVTNWGKEKKSPQ